ncbi:jg21342 [Pararge aegeria aegeria]|uniref:Jg21342 protein n=1 Tax=Pararge aegeria aegeria TaxID=348720 RepID=A0A8S4SAD4_9NEOP|nr:jg21342 [Pararge aegeria aegeria]
MTNRKVMNNKIIINSDSQTVLRSLASSSTTSNLIYDCHNALETLAASNDITLRWVKGHDGNPGNEAADSLARQATTLKVVGPEPIVPIPFSEYKTWLHEQTQREHSQLWANAKDCKQTKIAFPNLNQHLTNKLLRLDRSKLRKVVGLITGHSSLNRHLSIIGVTDSPLCRAWLEENETPTHVMLECTGVTEQHEIYLGSPATIPEVLSNLGGMLGFWNELGWLE